ncbi:hypothetical protein [Zoogloea sp.]|uniref:hypothetical protein n=1 Tax=Zoogloea sp. TaxID=49181 RepID=UPI00321FE954
MNLLRRTLFAMLLGLNLSAAAEHPEDVSIIRLVATPEQFDGRLVRVIGYFRAEFEGDSIYLHRQDYLQGITKNGLWVDLEGVKRSTVNQANQGYVLLEGVFRANDHGHLGLWSGSIDRVQRLERWSRPEAPPVKLRPR